MAGMAAGGLRIGAGALTGQETPMGPAAGRSQRDAVELAELAEGLGFDSVWLGEHHFSPDGYTGAVFPLLGAIAARTSRVVIGTRVVLAPLHPALLLAEDAAQVALLAEGRLILGLGLGYREEELQALGVPKAERGARLTEIVEVCRKAWTGEPFSHSGPTVRVNDLVCRPAPPGPPRIWLGGRAPRAIDRVAEIGEGYVAPVSGTAETLAAIEMLDAATRRRGRELLAVTTGGFVLASTDPAAAAALDAGIRAVLGLYDGWVTDEPDIRAGASDQDGLGVVRGDPAQVVALLAPRVRALAGREHHLTMRVSYPGMTRTQIENHMRLLATEVLPELRSIAADAVATSTRAEAGAQ